MKTAILHLETLAPGVTITFLRKDREGEFVPNGVVRSVLDFNEKSEVWRYSKQGSTTACGSIPKTGGGRDFMSKNPAPDYWITANPAHVKTSARMAERNRKASERAAKIQAEDEAKRMREFHRKFQTLLTNYGAEISAVQTSGDDQGVDVAIEISIGKTSMFLD